MDYAATDRGGGGGDADNVPKKDQMEEKSKGNEFAFHYGNYGDPYSLAPYQLLLLLLDFIFNWTMDLAHEDPLAVLVIFM